MRRSRRDAGSPFLCSIWCEKCSKTDKNAKKCKKMQKNEKKSQKNLHISKICCNFAPSFQNEGERKPKKQPKKQLQK